MNEVSSSPDLLEIFSLLDWSVFSAIIAATLAAVFYGHMRASRPSGEAAKFLDHLLMGRTLTLPMFTATLVATWYGGIFGVTELSFRSGIYNFLTQGVFWYVTYIVFALFIAKRAWESQAKTLPELVGQMFGPNSARVAAVFNFFNVVPIAYALSLGLLVQSFFGVELWLGTAVGMALVCSYSLLGGFRAVVFSDLVQFAVMCAAVLFVVLSAASSFGGMDYLRTNLPASHFSLTGGVPLSTTIVWGLIAMSTLVDPNFYQRCFAAASPQVAKRGILCATFVWVCFDICTTLGGMYARAAIPEADPGKAYLIYAIQILPDGLRGFFLAGLVATILSTIDSYIFVASNTLSYDLGPKRLRENLGMHRLGIVAVGILAVGLAQTFDGSIKDVWKTLGSYSAGCLLLPVLIGHIRPGLISDRSFLVGSLCGAVAITYWRFAEHSGFWENIDDLYLGIVGTLTGLLVAQLTKPATSG